MRALRRVRVRVTLAATLVALVLAAIGAAVFVSQLRSGLEQGLVDSSVQQVGQVQAQLGQGERPDQAVVSGKNDVIVQIVTSAGEVLATDHERIAEPLRTRPGQVRGERVRGFEDRYVVVARAVTDGSGNLIVVARSTEQVREATTEASVLFGLGIPIALALLAAVVWFSVGRALRPVEAMRREARTIELAQRERRLVVPPGDDEIPRLAETLNQMLDRIDEAHQLQRQFVSDASHELRSPLTALRQQAELAIADPATRALAEDVLAEETRMEDLVTALLVLARLDDDQVAPGTAVDLDDVVLAETTRLRRTSERVVDLSGVSAGQVYGDPVLLGQLVRNLVSNALRHATGTVHVALSETGDRVRLVVDDDGAGILDEDRARIFERFVRLDDSRSRDAGGSGLGLAIVRKVADAHRGTVAVDSAPGGGARFVVDLPRTAD